MPDFIKQEQKDLKLWIICSTFFSLCLFRSSWVSPLGTGRVCHVSNSRIINPCPNLRHFQSGFQVLIWGFCCAQIEVPLEDRRGYNYWNCGIGWKHIRSHGQPHCGIRHQVCGGCFKMYVNNLIRQFTDRILELGLDSETHSTCCVRLKIRRLLIKYIML